MSAAKSIPHVTRRRRVIADVPLSPDYLTLKAQRLEVGRVEYGDKSARTKTLMRLVVEIYEEFADVGGWAQIFRDRCELLDIRIPKHIELMLQSLDVVAVAGFSVLDKLMAWAREVEAK